MGDRAGAPSAMGMSMMSGMTQMTDVSVIGEDGTRMRVKKKRSAFGWLKKQFSLSEEEKRAFEERRRAPVVDPGMGVGGGYERGRREQRWVDGRRVR